MDELRVIATKLNDIYGTALTEDLLAVVNIGSSERDLILAHLRQFDDDGLGLLAMIIADIGQGAHLKQPPPPATGKE